MARVQAAVAQHKEKHPELYCPNRRCLWRTGGGWCPRHQPQYEGAEADPPQDRLYVHN